MVARRATALIASVVAACGAGAPSSRPVAGAPRGAAVIAHEATGDRLYVIDLAGGAPRAIGALGASHPLWSPDGRALAYLIGDRLWLHRDGAPDAAIADGVDDQARQPYAFRPDGLKIAVARRGAVAEVALGSPSEPVAIAARPDLRVADLLWQPDGSALMILFWAPSPPGAAELVRVAGTAFPPRPADGVTRLLGWRPSGELVAVIADDRGEHPAALQASGWTRLRPADEQLFVLDYARAADLLVLTEGGEDPGDDAHLVVAAPGSAPPVRWLSRHPRLSEIRISQDGRSAIFLDRATTGGGVYIARSIGAERTELILPTPTPDQFSAPTLRP